MLAGLRYFERQMKDDGTGHEKEAFSWGAVNRTALSVCMLSICQKVRELLQGEPRLLRLKPPTYILGITRFLFHVLGFTDGFVVMFLKGICMEIFKTWFALRKSCGVLVHT